jgi:hypothetical protein
MTRIREEYWEDGRLHVRYVEDVEPIMDDLSALRGTNGFSKSRNWRKIGSIPAIMIEKELRETGHNLMDTSPEGQKYLRRWLRENSKFKVEGNI